MKMVNIELNLSLRAYNTATLNIRSVFLPINYTLMELACPRVYDNFIYM